jgi:hypothetical protein
MPLPAVEVSTEQCTLPTVHFEGSLAEDFDELCSYNQPLMAVKSL